MTTPEDDPRLARLAMRLAIPDRGPDEHFAARIDYAVSARMLTQAAGRERREQLAIEVGAGAALLAGAHQIAGVGQELAAMLIPAATSLGGLAVVAVGASLLLSLFAGGDRRGLA
jgi:hypothetical protein